MFEKNLLNYEKTAFSVVIIVFLVIVFEFITGHVFISGLARNINYKRNNEYLEAWNNLLDKQKRINETKVTGYAWWTDLVVAVNENDEEFFIEEFYEDSFESEFDLSLLVGINGELLIGTMGGNNSIDFYEKIDEARDLDVEKFFQEKTNFKVAETLGKLSGDIDKDRKISVWTEESIWHYFIRYNDELYLMTLSPICLSKGIPYTMGYFLLGKKVETLLKEAETIIPAKLEIEKFDYKNQATANTILKDDFYGEEYELGIKPNLDITKMLIRSLSYFIMIQIIILLLILLIVLPRLVKFYSKKLNDIIEERTAELKSTVFDLNKTKKQLILSEKLASVGRMAGGIAHELNSPLGSIKTSVEMIKQQLKENDIDDSVFDDIETVELGMGKISETIKTLLIYTGKRKGILKLRLKKMIQESLELHRSEIKENLIDIEMIIDSDYFIEGEEISMIQALSNIFQNSIDALIKKDDSYKRIKIYIIESQGKLILCISDNGIGMKKDIIENIFDPFFTTKEIGTGKGLGMSIAYEILVGFGALIEVKSNLKEGTEIRITLNDWSK